MVLGKEPSPGVGVGVGMFGFELSLHAAEVARSAVANNTGRTDRRRMGLLNWPRGRRDLNRID
jgi:hypothetical protein